MNNSYRNERTNYLSTGRRLACVRHRTRIYDALFERSHHQVNVNNNKQHNTAYKPTDAG